MSKGTNKLQVKIPVADLRLFDEATERQRAREAGRIPVDRVTERGWRREDLYTRGNSR
jgi:hypothetical protein